MAIKELEELKVELLTPTIHKLVLFNDDVNTFDHVINCLVKHCEHSGTQAEQCAYIVHYNGKCVVKSGKYSKLDNICLTLLAKGLSVEIQN